jgi:hypothetical protein
MIVKFEPKRRRAASYRSCVQSNGDADPSKRRSSAPPKGVGLGFPALPLPRASRRFMMVIVKWTFEALNVRDQIGYS